MRVHRKHLRIGLRLVFNWTSRNDVDTKVLRPLRNNRIHTGNADSLSLTHSHTYTEERRNVLCTNGFVVSRVCAREWASESTKWWKRARARVYFEWIRLAVRMMCEKRVKKNRTYSHGHRGYIQWICFSYLVHRKIRVYFCIVLSLLCVDKHARYIFKCLYCTIKRKTKSKQFHAHTIHLGMDRPAGKRNRIEC